MDFFFAKRFLWIPSIISPLVTRVGRLSNRYQKMTVWCFTTSSKSITVPELEAMHELSGSYEALFSRKAQLYKSLDLKNKTLTETDYRNYILEHYTFLSRPVFIIDGKICIGNNQKVIAEVIKALS